MGGGGVEESMMSILHFRSLYTWSVFESTCFEPFVILHYARLCPQSTFGFIDHSFKILSGAQLYAGDEDLSDTQCERFFQ